MIRFSVVIVVMALVVASCGVRRIPPPTPEEGGETPAGPLFDPLGTSRDREVVPEVYPVQVAAVPDAGDSLVQPGDLSYLAFDSAATTTTPTEVYRVQIFTSRLFSEATQERHLAEEIFNLPIYLDYEVPYYKLRVGDFTVRADAEDMLAEIKAIGYRNAWVSRVMLRIKDAPEYELTDEPILPGQPADSLIAPADSADREEMRDDL